MKTPLFLAGMVCAVLSNFSFAANQRTDWARGLQLEQPAAGASLIAVVKLVGVEKTSLTGGGKMAMEIKQYRFKPLKIVKGVYTREELSLLSSDLGGYNLSQQLKAVKDGQIFLLFLARSDTGYRNSNGDASSLQHSMPMLKDENDPLVETVKTFLAMQAEPDEMKRVSMLLETLGKRKPEEIDAIPLLEALKSRALIAAQMPDTGKILAKYVRSYDNSVCIAAAETTSEVLGENYLNKEALKTDLAASLFAGLEQHVPDVATKRWPNVEARSALLAAWGALGEYGMKFDPGYTDAGHARASDESDVPAAMGFFSLPGETLAEQEVKLRAMGEIGAAVFVPDLTDSLRKMPLDAISTLQEACEESLCKIAPEQAGKEILDRIQHKAAAGLDAAVELQSVARLPRAQLATLLGQVADSLGNWKFGDKEKHPFETSASTGERVTFALSCVEATKKPTDGTKPAGENLVATLSQLLDPDERARPTAIEALMNIDTDGAAKALQPHLKEEGNLLSKLKLAEFLGKHGIKEGYPYAMEHLSDSWLTEQAAAALAAIKDPKTAGQLKQILAESNDVTWNRSAIFAMGITGMKDQADNFLKIVNDWNNPLAASALLALGDLGEIKALPKAEEAFASRNDAIAGAGLRTAGKLLAAHAEVKSDGVRDKIAALLVAADGSEYVRSAALDALVLLNDSRLDAALLAAMTDAKLEQMPLRQKIEKQLRDRKVVLVK